MRFAYQVIRVWQLPVETILSGGLGTLPLAPISAVTQEEIPAVEAIADLARLEELSVRLLDAASCEKLLGLPEPARRSTRRKPKP